MTPHATVKTRGFLLTERRYGVFQRITRRRVFEYDRMILRLVPPIELSALNFEPIYCLFAFTHFYINAVKGLTQRLNDVCINEMNQMNQINQIIVSRHRPQGY
jgi:hypothetical protein